MGDVLVILGYGVLGYLAIGSVLSCILMIHHLIGTVRGKYDGQTFDPVRRAGRMVCVTFTWPYDLWKGVDD